MSGALRLARPVLIGLMALSVVTFLAGLVVHAQALSQVCVDARAQCAQVPGHLSPAEAAGLQAQGLSMRAYAALQVGRLLVFAGVWFAVGGLILLRRRNEWIALVVAFTLVTFPTQFDLVPATLARAMPALWLPVQGLYFLVDLALPLFLGLFPNGRWTPRWTAWVVVVLGLVSAWQRFGPAGSPAMDTQQAGAQQLVMLGLLGLLLVAQVIRYRRYSTAVERVQTRWVLGGLAGALGLVTVLIVVAVAGVLPSTGWQATFVTQMIYQTVMVLIPLSVGMAILRSRLFDIDLIVRRTLVYSLLTGLLALTYLGSVLVLENTLRLVTGQGQNSIVVVLSTLTIAALFVPLRRRVQAFIDRRFYRSKYDAVRTLAGFAAGARDTVELEMLTSRLVEVVDETMQPASVGLWLKPAADKQRGARG